jgi:hypothetical protein
MRTPDNPQSPGRAPTRQWAEANYYATSYTKLRLAAESNAPEVPRGCDRLHAAGWIDGRLFARVRGMDGFTLEREIRRALGRGRLADAEAMLCEKRRRWLWVREQLGFGGAA